MRIFTCLAFVLLASAAVGGQQSARLSGTISGRVTISGKPAPGVVISVTESGQGNLLLTPGRMVRTDAEGRYQVADLSPGEYSIFLLGDVYVAQQNDEAVSRAKTVLVGEGEAVEGVDFQLVRGGVITGRVTNTHGQPLIEQPINLFRLDKNGRWEMQRNRNLWNLQTDDRGIYRAYGLPPGRYRVSVGSTATAGRFVFGVQGKTIPHTYYPNAIDEEGAGVVEVTAGAEMAGIDIVVADAANIYTASGRIIDADTGQPVPGVQYGHGAVHPDRNSTGAFGLTGNRSDSQGRFRLEGLAPGRYAAFASPGENDSFYSEMTFFEVTNGNVEGLEIKVRRGATISGTAVVEGSSDPEVLAELPELYIAIHSAPIDGSEPEGSRPPRLNTGRIRPDGSFVFNGIRPGRVSFYLNPYFGPKGFSLARIERDGLEQDLIEVPSGGASISGVRLVLAYGTTVVRGQIKAENGALPTDWPTSIKVFRAGQVERIVAQADADIRGRFTVQGLAAGDYIFVVETSLPSIGGSEKRQRKTARKQVTVPASGEIDVVIPIDLAASNNNKQQ